MQDLIQIETTPASIVANFDEVEAQLQEYLKQYDVVVTPDRVGDAKKLRTELRKQISELDSRIKDALKDVSAPIREADERRKQLVQLGRDVDNKIKEQVEHCEVETKDKARRLLHERREELWQQHGVEFEFRNARIDDLVKLSAITKKERLSKSAATELENRVHADAAQQHKIQLRLANLSAHSSEAGLAAPLTRDHVEHFLFSDDAKYESELQRILDAEVDRQARAEQRARDQAERDQRAKAEAEQREADRQRRIEDAAAAERATPQEAAADPVPEPTANQGQNIPENIPASGQVPERSSTQPTADGRVTYYVTATFEIRVAPQTTVEQIRNGAKKVLEGAGIKTLRNVSAQPAQRAA